MRRTAWTSRPARRGRRGGAGGHPARRVHPGAGAGAGAAGRGPQPGGVVSDHPAMRRNRSGKSPLRPRSVWLKKPGPPHQIERKNDDENHNRNNTSAVDVHSGRVRGCRRGRWGPVSNRTLSSEFASDTHIVEPNGDDERTGARRVGNRPSQQHAVSKARHPDGRLLSCDVGVERRENTPGTGQLPGRQGAVRIQCLAPGQWRGAHPHLQRH